jgi:hypothetical protein
MRSFPEKVGVGPLPQLTELRTHYDFIFCERLAKSSNKYAVSNGITDV